MNPSRLADSAIPAALLSATRRICTCQNDTPDSVSSLMQHLLATSTDKHRLRSLLQDGIMRRSPERHHVLIAMLVIDNLDLTAMPKDIRVLAGQIAAGHIRRSFMSGATRP